MTSIKEPEYITMSVLKQVMDTQEKAFKSAIKILIEDVKSEVKDIRKEIEELKLSVKFMSGKYDDVKEKIDKADNEINGVYAQIKSINKEMNDGFEDLEWKQEYLENQSRRNNIKITGVQEDDTEKTWDDTEMIVKKMLREKLGIEEEVKIERAHRVGKKLKSRAPPRHDGSASLSSGSSRPIIAKIQSWKTKETILKVARKKRPKGIQFMGDFSRRTLERRASKIPEMLEARKEGKTAFMVMDKLIIYDRPLDPDKNRNVRSRIEHSENDDDDEVLLSNRLHRK